MSRSSPALAVVGNAQHEAAIVAAGVAAGGDGAQTTAASSSLRVAPLVYSPARPPPPKKTRPRKKGLALLPLEGADLFRQCDWKNIEAFASTRMPMFSVAWATLKGYESCWKQWVSFQYYAQLDIFVEFSSPATRRRTATWVLSFVALLAYAAGYKASTIKNISWRSVFFTWRISMLRRCRVFGRPIVLLSGIRGPVSVSIRSPLLMPISAP